MLQLLLFYKEMFQLLLFFLFIGLFIYGMTILRSRLFTLSENPLKKGIVSLIDSPWKGLIAGVLITMVLQSSSAVIIITMGLISARILTFPQSIGIILGTNIGKTITTEIIIIDIDFLIIPFVVIGGTLVFMKEKNVYHIGYVLLGLAAIFGAMWGFEYLAGSLKDIEIINQLLLAIEESYFYAILAGIVAAGAIQSSCAVIGIVMGFLSAGVMELETGIVIMLGTIIGTCVNVLFLGFISHNREERLAAYAYTWVNVAGVAAFYPLIGLLASIGQQLSTHPDVQLAHVSVIFNLVTSIIVLPIANQFGRFILKIHDNKKKSI